MNKKDKQWVIDAIYSSESHHLQSSLHVDVMKPFDCPFCGRVTASITACAKGAPPIYQYGILQHNYKHYTQCLGCGKKFEQGKMTWVEIE